MWQWSATLATSVGGHVLWNLSRRQVLDDRVISSNAVVVAAKGDAETGVLRGNVWAGALESPSQLKYGFHEGLVGELSLELMDQGSYQVEMSDEGLMTDDIEACLRPVLKALHACDLPAAELIAWCAEMLKADRVGFICDQELRTLRQQFDAAVILTRRPSPADDTGPLKSPPARSPERHSSWGVGIWSMSMRLRYVC